MQAIQLQLLPFQDVTSFLNCEKFEHFLKCSGKEFHRTGAAYLNEFFPAVVVLTLGICNIFEYLKDITEFFLTIRFDKTGGDIS